MRELIDRLKAERTLPDRELLLLLTQAGSREREYLFAQARQVSQARFGSWVYTRGLIEFTNYCRCDCYYCGIRRGNQKASRYRLEPEEILRRCADGYRLGFRTFVLQGGEDPYATDQRMVALVQAIKAAHPDCAVTLSIGERSPESYRLLRQAGADRYLLRHETATPSHYARLHPPAQTLEHRMACLWELKRLGYQVGAGFMVGSPWQTADCLVADLRFLEKLQPAMVGIGPFIPHKDTPFRDEPAGSIPQTILMLALTRILLPHVLLPATTALGTLDPMGREKGMDAGANVVMPNLSPTDVRQLYTLYDGKLSTGEEAAEGLKALTQRILAAGYQPDFSRGDYKA